MKAMAADGYGGPEVLTLRDLPTPRLGPDSVLVRTRAAGVNPVDYKILQGLRDAAFDTVYPLIPGWDMAGEVEAVGPAVTGVRPGDEVFAYARKDFVGHGTWAELTAVPVRCVASAPEAADAVSAAAVPLAGLTAYQALTERLQVAGGMTVLVHAASGGVGSFATQIAVARGARVIGTTGARNAGYLQELGAEPVAYGEGLVERVRELAPDGVDAVLDLVGGAALRDSPALLRPHGRLVSVVDATEVSRLGGSYAFVRPDAAGLAELARLVDSGRLRVEVQRVLPLAEAVEALRLQKSGHVRGKLVLEVSP